MSQLSLVYWKAYNHTSNVGIKTSEVRSTNAPHMFSTTTYRGEHDAPLVRFTQVDNSCHAYMEDQAYMIWEDFFSKYTRKADGTLYYNGQRVDISNTSTSSKFKDISDSWAKSQIEKAVDENGLFAGTSATTFAPEMGMTRAMFVSVLYRMDVNAQALTLDTAFTDVESDSYYENAVAWAAENGIVYGTSKTTFAPNLNITREEIVSLLQRYAVYKGYDVSQSTSLSAYTDASTVSDYATNPMKWAVAQKMIVGRPASTLAPKATATRAEAAKILNSFLDIYMK